MRLADLSQARDEEERVKGERRFRGVSVATAHYLNHRYSEVCDLTLGAQYDGRPYVGESTILRSDRPTRCPTVVSSRPMHFIETSC